MIKKFLTFIALCATIVASVNAQVVFSSTGADYPYRIPAIATLKNGKVLAISDYRPCYKDVGNGEVDMYAKIANLNTDGTFPNNATTTCIADGTSSNGYGDAALVVDRESGNVLVICVAGKQVFSNGSSSKHNKMARIVATANEETGAITWQSPQDVTTAFFDNLLPKAYTMFMASGRMIQSQQVKIGNYYRIYGALLVNESGGNNNYVVYSDDFGANWTVLGGTKAISSGDEAKVEELPNGDIVVSSRTSGARIFNVYSMSNNSWGTQQTYTFGGANCNGELLFYKGLVSKADGKTYNVMLQSLPAGTSGNESRSNVTVFYKAFDTNKTNWSTDDFTSGWQKGLVVDSETSAYSTMTILPNGNIGFLYEDGEVKFKHGTLNLSTSYGYDITFRNITVEEITGEAFTLPTPVVKTVGNPVITPDGGNVFDTQNITLSCATEGAAIYYTTDGTEPTSSSTLYTGPFTLNESATVKAIAVKEDYDNSQVVAANFNVTKAGTTYRFKNVQKNGTCYYFTYDATNGIGLTTNVEEAAMYIRGEGATPGTYTYQTIDGNYLIFSGRNVGGQSCNKGYNDGKGFLTSYESAKCDLTVAKLVAGGEVESFTGEYYTITGQRDYKKNSYSTATQQQAYFVITPEGKFDGATAPYYNSNYSSAFIIEEMKNEPVVKKVATPVFSLPSGTYDEGTKLSVTCATEGAKIYLALDANWPAEEWVEYSDGMLEIFEDITTIYAIAKLDGWEDSNIASAEYTAIMPLTTPVINPTSGKVEKGTEVTITCATEGATIYYTTNGEEPTTTSAVYSAPIVVSEEMTIKAFAVKNGYINSAVATASYTIKETKTPTFSIEDDEIVAGTTVTIACTTEGATIYYTTDGTEPTTASAVYSAPIVVNEEMTIKAFAVKDGYINSAVATVSYTIIVINEYTVKPGTGILDNTTCYLTTFSASEPTVVPVGVTAFYATIDNDNNITLISIGRGEAIPAGEGVILKASNSKEFKMTTAKKKVPEANLSGNRLVGTCDVVNFTFEKDGYALTVKGSGSLKGQYAFSKVSAGRTLSNYNNRAYLDLSTSKAFSNSFRLSFGDTTGLEPVTEEEETEEVIYDLSGRRVTEMVPGNIYIINGKKVLKK